MALIINTRGQRLNLPAGTERKLETLVEGEEMMRGFFFFFLRTTENLKRVTQIKVCCLLKENIIRRLRLCERRADCSLVGAPETFLINAYWL